MTRRDQEQEHFMQRMGDALARAQKLSKEASKAKQLRVDKDHLLSKISSMELVNRTMKETIQTLKKENTKLLPTSKKFSQVVKANATLSTKAATLETENDR